MSAPTAVMIFAAGFGTRMGHLTKDRPKPMIEVAGRPLIDHALDLVADVAPQRVVINTHYKADVLHNHLAQRDVVISHEAEQILDTGGGLRHAMPLLQTDTVFTLNPDVTWRGPNPLRYLADHWQPGHMDALLLCVPIERAMGRRGPGDFSTDKQGRILRGGDLVYSGAQIIKLAGLQDIPQTSFSLNVLWDHLLAQRRAYACPYPGHWCDVGHPEGIEQATEMMLKSNV